MYNLSIQDDNFAGKNVQVAPNIYFLLSISWTAVYVETFFMSNK